VVRRATDRLLTATGPAPSGPPRARRPPRGGHNVSVTPRSRARSAIVAIVLVPALLLSGCGADAKAKPEAEPSAAPSPSSLPVPAGITLTEPGTELKFGEAAVVAHEPDPPRSSVLALIVRSVQAGRIRDLARYQLDERTRKSRVYYARFSVKNVGTGDLSRTAVPLYALTNTNALVRPSSFISVPFRRCPSVPLPAGFVGGKLLSGCLVYLVPDGGTLVAMSYRPVPTVEPITWTGTILPPVTSKPQKKSTEKKSGTGKKANP
jgi:hypothetical protein